MRPTVKRAEDGYAIWGLEPPELAQSHGFFRKMFWGWVVEFGLREKDRELTRGLDKDGRPLAPISEETRKHRRSAMTPSGKGDPDAPPLTPGWQKSRTRSLLKGRPYFDHADFFWAYDAHTGDSWATILEHQAKVGRDVFGLSEPAIERVRRAATRRWELYKKGLYEDKPKPAKQPERPQPRTVEGFPDIRGKTSKEWQTYFRETAKAAPPGRPLRPKVMSPISGPLYSRLIAHVHGVPVQRPKPAIVRAKRIAVVIPEPDWLRLR